MLQNQLFKNFEVILIDDCSTDDSKYMVKTLISTTDLSFKILSTDSNSGPGCARNVGLKAAKGKYLLFIDADDWIEKDTLSYIYENYLSYGDFDLLLFDYKRVYKDKTIECKDLNFNPGAVDKYELLSVSNFGVTRKVIKRMILEENQIRFPEWRNGEDIYVELFIISFSNCILYIDKAFYNYLQHSNSISNTKTDNLYFYNDLFTVFESLYKFKDTIYYTRVALDLYYNTMVLFLKNNVLYSFMENYIDDLNINHPNITHLINRNLFSKKQLLIIYLSYFKKFKLLKLIERIRRILTK